MRDERFKIEKIQSHSFEDLSKNSISAVFLIGFVHGQILSTLNERGWDIPGGHVLPDETLLQALAREVKEETGAEIGTVHAFATLSELQSSKKMLFFVTDSLVLGALHPSEDVRGREFFTPEELLSRYYGNKEILRQLLEMARSL